VPPAVVGEEPVVAAGDELGAVFEHEAVRGLDGRPVVEHTRAHVPAVLALALGAVDLVAHGHVGERLVRAVGHEDRRLARQAVDACVRATPVRVDRPAKRHLRRRRHAVERRLRLHLVEAHVERLGSVEAAHARLVAVSGQARALVFGNGEVVPAHEHMFS
jgi:hypothetical protein